MDVRRFAAAVLRRRPGTDTGSVDRGESTTLSVSDVSGLPLEDMSMSEPKPPRRLCWPPPRPLTGIDMVRLMARRTEFWEPTL